MNNCVILTLKNQKALKDRKFQKIRIVLANGCMFMYNFFSWDLCLTHATRWKDLLNEYVQCCFLYTLLGLLAQDLLSVCYNSSIIWALKLLISILTFLWHSSVHWAIQEHEWISIHREHEWISIHSILVIPVIDFLKVH